jgi:hypothetical protein
MSKTLEKAVVSVGFVCCLAAAGFAQSLGELARQERLKRQQNPQSAPKVITNDDLAPAEHDDTQKPPSSDPRPSRPTKSAAEWKVEIAAQTKKVASLEAQIQRLNSTVRFSSPTCYYHCVEHNENQLKKEDQVQRMRDQLNEEQTKLDDLKEGARQDGFGNSVYEP